MAGFSFGNLFQRDNLYDDEGNLRSIGTQDYAGKYKTQLIDSGQAVGAVTTTIYTIPANTVFYLAQYNIECTANTGGVACYMKKNAAAAFKTIYKNIIVAANDTNIVQASLTMPLRFVAGDTIDLQTDSANGLIIANIHGWIEDA